MKQYEGTATLTYDGKVLHFAISDWWWEDNLLVLVTKDGKREYFNRNKIDHLRVPNRN